MRSNIGQLETRWSQLVALLWFAGAEQFEHREREQEGERGSEEFSQHVDQLQ